MGAENGVGDGVKAAIGVGMSQKRERGRDLDPAQPNAVARDEAVNIEPLAGDGDHLILRFAADQRLSEREIVTPP